MNKAKVEVCNDHYDCRECSTYLDYAVERAHADAIQAAADAAEHAWTDVASLGACKMAADCILALTPTLARLRRELREQEMVLVSLEKLENVAEKKKILVIPTNCSEHCGTKQMRNTSSSPPPARRLRPRKEKGII